MAKATTTVLVTLITFLVLSSRELSAQTYYDLGTPTVTDIWVNPVSGNDNHSGNYRGQALQTLTAAWNRIPQGTTLTTTGYRVMLTAGTYPESSLPNYLESRHGTAQFPIIFQAADGRGTAILGGDLNIFDCRYLYLIDFTLRPSPAGDALHAEQCNYLLMRGMEMDGGLWVREGQSTAVAHETVKINQSQHVYFEDCNIHGAEDNAVDCVAVQYGHAIGNRLHNANDWAMYVKGGSAYWHIEGNEIYDAGTGGFTCGQGSGFEFMTAPWLHYETYDIKVINNIVHDTQGAGLGVNGGYNILLAHNTLYRVGQRSHVLEVVFGRRGCDGTTARCQEYRNAGGWGTTGAEEAYIPNRNVYIYNNIIYNPPGYQSQYQHLSVPGPATPPSGSNVAASSHADTNLQIRGNIIWNGATNHPLGIEENTQGCQPGNATCNQTQLRAANAINTIQPQLVNPGNGDFRPTPSSNVLSAPTYVIPDFTWSDAPTLPTIPTGKFSNTIKNDRTNALLSSPGIAGALAGTGYGLATVSAASYDRYSAVAADAIVSTFGADLATTTSVATAIPLPTSLAGTTVRVRDSANVERLASLFFVSPNQVNYQIPTDTAHGIATVTITSGNNVISQGSVVIAAVAPALFCADANGRGWAAAEIQRVRGAQSTFEMTARYDTAQGKAVAIPIDFGPESDQLFLVLYATGVRSRTNLSNVRAKVGGVDSEVLYAATQHGYAGLDQINVRLSRSLIGRGETDVVLTVDGKIANTVKIHLQ